MQNYSVIREYRMYKGVKNGLALSLQILNNQKKTSNLSRSAFPRNNKTSFQILNKELIRKKQTVIIKVCNEKNTYNEVQYRNINFALKRNRRNNMLSPYKKLKQYLLIKLRIQKKGQLFLLQKKKNKGFRRGLNKEIQDAKLELELVHITLGSNNSSICIQESPKPRLQNYAKNSDYGCEQLYYEQSSFQQIFPEQQYYSQEKIQFYQSQSGIYVEKQDNLIDGPEILQGLEYMSQEEQYQENWEQNKSLEEQIEVEDKPKRKINLKKKIAQNVHLDA